MNEQNRANRQQLGAVILAGGRSRRMGYDKADLRLQGLSFVEHLVSRFETAGFPVVIVGGKSWEANGKFASFGVSVVLVHDERVDAGPLEGIRIGLATIEKRAEFAFVISCDSPLLKLEFVLALMSRIGSSQAIVPRSETEIHGTTAVYRTDLHHLIDQELTRGNHSVQRMLANLDVQFVEVDELRVVDPNLESLININTPEEYDRVRNTFGH